MGQQACIWSARHGHFKTDLVGNKPWVSEVSWGPRSGGPRPTEERVAAKRKELEAALQQAGIPVAPSAQTKLYQYYVRSLWPT